MNPDSLTPGTQRDRRMPRVAPAPLARTSGPHFTPPCRQCRYPLIASDKSVCPRCAEPDWTVR